MPKHKQIAPGRTVAEQVAELRRWINSNRWLCIDLERGEKRSPASREHEALLRSEIAEWEAEIKRRRSPHERSDAPRNLARQHASRLP